MPYTNNHLIEVVCGLQFPNESTPWDSTLFGQFYERIKSTGFTEKEERKGFQLEINPEKGPQIDSTTVEENVIFKDNSRGWAIMMGKNKISFHVVHNYMEWSIFQKDFILPYFEYYTQLGLGNGARKANVLYLNRFTLPIEDSLGEYFSIVSSLPPSFGEEVFTNVQRTFNTSKNQLFAKLNCRQDKEQKEIKTVNLECGASCIDQSICDSASLVDQINSTHDPIKSFFEAIITEKLRNKL